MMMVAMFAACDKEGSGEPVCGVVKVAEGCKAQCSRLAPQEGGPTQVCVKQLISRRDGENAILKSDIKKVRTVQMPKEVCFEVQDGAPKDPAMVQQLTAACGAAE
ncbi:MAG: hypothetical protein CMH57_00735 [Myxococcales bacterium]|nr:hypothetical protein [Myxococcales bacterium]